MKVNWNEVKANELGNKIYLKHLPRHGRNYISWKNSIGYIVPVLYNGQEYQVSIDDYDTDSRDLTINIVDWDIKQDFKIHSSEFIKCKLRSLFNSVLNPNYQYRNLLIENLGLDYIRENKLTVYSSQKITIKCPNCKHPKEIRLSDLTRRGIGCQVCGDGVSYPEKLTRYILEHLQIPFETQVSFDNGKHRNDFLLNGEIIIETHGKQHYEHSFEGIGERARKLEEEQANDKLKREIAIQNCIKNENYYEIDCRESTVEWIRPRLEEVLSKYFDISSLTDDVWKQADKQAQSSLRYKACQLWNEGRKVKEIAPILGVSEVTVSCYLNWGTKLELCYYNGKKESMEARRTEETRRKISKTLKGKYAGENNSHARKVICLNDNKIFYCIKDCATFYKISTSTIRKYIKGIQKGVTHNTKYHPNGELFQFAYYEKEEE